MTSESVESIVRSFEDAYAAAFRRRDAKAFSALLAEDATIMTEWGDIVHGRAAIEQALGSVFARMTGELALENRPSSWKAVTEDVIVSHGASHKFGPWGAVEGTLFYTRVLVRREGVWRLAATQVAPPSVTRSPLE